MAIGKLNCGEPGGQRIVLATANPGKLREFQCLLGKDRVLVPQSELGIAAAEETGASFAENALIKARHASTAANLPAIADDSGLEVDALDGAPGIRSARYAEDRGSADAATNNAKLLAELAHVPPGKRSARFRAVIVYVDSARNSPPIIAEGVWEGRIAECPAGENGFGYDPVFIDAESGLTAGELGPDVKNLRSHRARAVQALRMVLGAPTADQDR